MSNGRQIDTTLVIKARDEATRAVAAIDGALKQLFGTQKDVASNGAQVAAAIADIDRAFAKAKGATDASVSSTQRHVEAQARAGAQLRSLRRQLDAASAAQEKFNKIIGPQTEGTQQRYALVGAEIKNLERDIKSLERTIEKQESQFTRSSSSLAEMARQQKLAGAVATFATQEANEYTRALERQAAAAAELSTMSRISAATDQRSFKSAAASASAFTQLGPTSYEAAEANALSAAAARLRNEMNPLAAIQDRLNRELAELPRVAKAGKFSVEELAAAEKLLRDEADRAARALGQQSAGGNRPTLFGLKPYELQNLGYQVNDVVTQLASGTSLTQTLAQQGGQLLQIFPEVGSQIMAVVKNPYILGAVATVGLLAAAFKEVGDEAERIRGFETLLGMNVDRGDYNTQALNDASEALDHYGISAETATEAVRIFVENGLNPSQIEAFGRTAVNLADIMGGEVTDAAKEVAEAFTSSFDAIDELDKAYNFLTSSQRETIRTMFEEGQAVDAQRMAYEIFAEKVDDTAEKARGPWSSAFRELGNAWEEFINWVSELAPIQAAAEAVGNLGRKAAESIRLIRGAASLAEIDAKIAQLEAEQDAIDRGRRAARERFGFDPTVDLGAPMRDNALASLRKQREEIIARNEAEKEGVALTAQQAEQRKKDTEDLRRATESEKEKKSVAEAEAVARRKATEYVNENFKLADQALKTAYIEQEVAEARAAAQKKIADERKRAADAAAAEAREQERIAKQTKFRNPVAGSVTSGFGLRTDPITGKKKQHNGIDFGVPVGAVVTAPAAGVVTKIDSDALNGKYIVIDHGNKHESKLLHLSDNSIVSKGDFVTAGQTVAKSGNTGRSTGAHLHWQVTVNGKPVDGSKGTFPLDGAQRFEINPGEAVTDYEAEQEKLAKDREERHQKFNRELQQQNAEQAIAIIQLREQEGLRGEALIALQREQAIEQAIADVRTDLDNVNATLKPGQERLELTEQQVAEVRELAGAYFDASHARDIFEAQRSEVDDPVARLTQLRDELQQRIAFYQERGQTGLANQLDPQLDAVNAKLAQAIEKAREFYAALGDNPTALAALGLTKDEIEIIRMKLDATGAASEKWAYIMGVSGQQIAQVFANQATSAIDGFAQAVAKGENVFTSLMHAFMQFAAEFIRQIAQMIMQQITFNAVAGLFKSGGGVPGLGSGGGGLPGFLLPGGGFGGGVELHNGGVVGSGGKSVSINPSWFANAARYHTGGIAGLLPNEIPAILQRGEEVLRRNDPRHAMNGGGSETVMKTRIINIIDSSDQLDQALNGRGNGEKVMLNFIRRNATAIKSALS